MPALTEIGSAILPFVPGRQANGAGLLVCMMIGAVLAHLIVLGPSAGEIQIHSAHKTNLFSRYFLFSGKNKCVVANNSKYAVERKLKKLFTICSAIGLCTIATATFAQEMQTAPADTRPNVVVLVVDDAGLMDFPAFGGEARMPNLDRLAELGVMFTGYRTSPLCAPSRAMLLTGVDNHRTGIATIPEVLRPEDKDKPGYSMRLEPGVQTIAGRLKGAGYRTYMTGKWHLGSGEGDLPNHHGFDRSFTLDASGADNWEQKPYMPYNSFAPWYEDGEPADLPEDFYSSKFLVDKLIDYLEEGSDKDAPFFAYVGFQAIHIPLQAPREFTEKYAGVYDEGWNALRTARWKRAQDLGMIPAGASLAPMPESGREWETLSDEDKRRFSKSMAVHAGMLEAMDFHIGRLIAHLKAAGELENTLFVVTSDNGPEPTNMTDALIMRVWMKFNGYHLDVETMGEKGSMGFIGPEWASATAAPSDLFKFYAAEGGIRVPLIISGAGIEARAPIRSIAMVTDLTPTILDFAGVEVSENEPVPINGRSLRPVLDGTATAAHAATTPIGLEVAGNAALFLGDYKLVRNTRPDSDGVWRLYNLSEDPGEANDLTAADPERVQSMMAHYQRYVKEFGVIELGDDFDVDVQMIANTIRKVLAQYWLYLLVMPVLLLGVLGLLSRLIWRKSRAVR